MGRHPLAARVRRARRVRRRALRLPGGDRRGARAGDHQPDRRQPGRTDAHRARLRGAEAPLPAADPARRGALVPALLGARGRLRLDRAPDARRPPWRRLDRQRAEGVDELRAIRALGDPPRPDGSGGAEGEGHQLLHLRHGGARRDRAPAPPDDGRRGVQRGLPRGRLHRARARDLAAPARHPSDAPRRSAAARARGRRGRGAAGEGPGRPPAARAAPDRGRDHAAQQLAHPDAPPASRAARAGVELREALLVGDEPADARYADAPPRPRGALLATGSAGGRRRTARAVVPLLPRGVDLRRHVGDPAEHPGRARARAAARAVSVMTSDDPLTGPRVQLRPFRLGDAAAVLAYASDPEVTRHLDWDSYDDPALAEAFIRSTLTRSPSWFPRAVVLRAADAVIGGVDLRIVSPRDRRAELGYGLARAYWGQGLASEAAGLLLRFGFEHLGLVRIEALCAVDNERSLRTLERLGMRREGRLAQYRWKKGGPRDHFLYAMTRTS